MRRYIAILAMLAASSAFSQATFDEAVDEFTGEDNSSVSVPGQSQELFLGWKCFSDGLNVLVLTSYLIGDRDDEVYVRYKFDDEEPSSTKYFDLASNNKGIYFDMSQVSQFTKQAIKAEQVMIRVTDPADSERSTDTFKLSGLEAALKNLNCYPQ